MNIPKELQELRANTEELVKKYKEIKAMSPESISPDYNNRMQDIEELIFDLISRVHSRISYLEDRFYDWTYAHMQNHLPNPSNPSDMQTALDNLGLAKDFDVKKRTIYASTKCGFENLK